MKILYVGDIMAEPGQKVLAKLLPEIKSEYGVDYVIAQAENSSPDGKGPGKTEIQAMHNTGADFFSGGNHSLTGAGSGELYGDENSLVIRPANLKGAPGSGYKIVSTNFGNVLIISMLGQTVGRQLDISNPLDKIDEILEETKDEELVARIVNFHGDFSSEKRVFGYYLDGRVSAVVGDHWHVPTADAMILPRGTAHITDVGMCGTLHSSLGVRIDVIAERWKTNKASKNEIEFEGPLQFNAVLIDVNTDTELATNIQSIQRIVEQ